MPSFSAVRNKRRKQKRKAKIAKKSNGRMNQRPAASAAPKNKKLTVLDLDDDCVIAIFDYLEAIDDLVNVAEAHPRFGKSARSVFSRKHGSDEVTVTNFNPTGSVRSLPSAILLRYFGDLISKLHVNYHTDFYRFNSALESAIWKYCKMVTEIEWVNLDKFGFSQLKKKPLPSVKKVVFTRCVLGRFVSDFSKWFPNASSLDFKKSKVFYAAETKCIEQHFPKVEHLGIINSKRGDEGFDYKYASNNECESKIIRKVFTNVNVMAAIAKNPQLKSLTLNHTDDDFRGDNSDDGDGIKLNSDMLMYLNENLPLLECLDLTITQYDLVSGDPLVKSFAKLQKVSINFKSSYTLDYLPISTNQLDELVLSGKELDGQCAKFLKQQKGCKKLVLRGKWENGECFDAAIKFIKRLPNLKSIELPFNGLTGKQMNIMSLLDDCASLTHLAVTYDVFNYKFMGDDEEENIYDADNEYSEPEHTYRDPERGKVKLSYLIEHMPGKLWLAKNVVFVSSVLI